VQLIKKETKRARLTKWFSFFLTATYLSGMHPIILFLKTYRPDFERVQRLLQSIGQFNADNIPVYLSINDEDYSFFKKNLPGNYEMMKDSDVVQSKMKDKWRHQAIVKPAVYELGICHNYLVVDSDGFFIRPFYKTDFLYDDLTPYTIMHEHKSFMDTLEILGKDSSAIFHVEALKAIRQRFGTHGKTWDYGPNPHLWSTKVWQHFHEQWLKPQGYSFESFYRNMEETSALPHEAAIYGEYLLKTRLIDILPIEGFFIVYHYQEQFELEKQWYDIERLSKNYLGIIMQSNWSGQHFESPSSKSFFNWFKK
jgi:hypothetical protein